MLNEATLEPTRSESDMAQLYLKLNLFQSPSTSSVLMSIVNTCSYTSYLHLASLFYSLELQCHMMCRGPKHYEKKRL